MVFVHLHHLRSTLVKISETLQVAMVVMVVGVIRGKDCLDFVIYLFIYFGPWKEVPVEEISLGQILSACILSGIRTGVLELGTYRTTTAPGSWSTGVLGMSMVLVL